jgi:hypothetical protein
MLSLRRVDWMPPREHVVQARGSPLRLRAAQGAAAASRGHRRAPASRAARAAMLQPAHFDWLSFLG